MLTKPSAFVVMPFSAVQDELFRAVIAPELAGAGYSVERADTTSNQRAIMHDVVRGIQAADLVVADLTGRNPNVFYELGLSHALDKRVLMIAQSTNDIPFDLGAYRVMTYSVSFEDGVLGSDLGERLRSVLPAARSGVADFGSPFRDYRDLQAGKPVSRPGYLDDAVAMADTVEPFLAILDRIAQLLNGLAHEQTAAARSLGVAREGEELRHARSVYAAYAPIWLAYAQLFEALVNDELQPQVATIQAGARAFLRLIEFGDDGRGDGRKHYMQSMESMSDAARGYLPIFGQLVETVEKYSGLSASLSEAGDRLGMVLGQIRNLFGELATLGEALLNETGDRAGQAQAT